MVKIIVLLFMFTAVSFGESWKLDGIDDKIVTNMIPSVALSTGQSFTFETWVNFTVKPVSDNTGTIMSAYSVPNSIFLWLIYKGGSFYVGYGNYIFEAATRIYPPFPGWWHVAWSWDFGKATNKIYVNGKLAWEYPAVANGALSPDTLNIGCFRHFNYFAGALFDETRFWNYARSDSQIESSYARAIAPEQTGLVFYYNYDEKTGTAKNLAEAGKYDATRIGTTAADNAPVFKFIR